nr:immunoglobulin heavy chain junction region [Mus musculus]MBK4184612.1 immunoglobulin heavy chain junction region [Mus musculus]
SVREHRGLS